MQDLDFDELDKAVSSLMPQSAPTVAPVTAPAAPVAPATPTPVSVPIPTPAPTIAPVNAVERPVTGRFMDVVHPSSDMRTALNMPQRQSTPMTPVAAPAPAPVQPVYTPPAPVIAPAPVVATSPAPAPVGPSLANNWAGLPTPPMANSAPESPFLPETKVEKRPLGAFSDELPQPPAAMPEPASIAQTTVAEPVPQIQNSTQPDLESALPAELDTSLLQIESDSSTHPDDANLSSGIVDQSSVPTSINQQYEEQPSSSDTTSGAIYDTSAYHSAIASKPHKKSGWKWVIWILILLILGAGAGVAFYFYVMPNYLPDFKLPF